jgi:hypothetical protein
MMSKSWAPTDDCSLIYPIFHLLAVFCSLTFGTWSKHDEHIGSVELPANVDAADFIGAEKETR